MIWPLLHGGATPTPGPLPVPTREQILTARCTFQGATANTSLGTYPWFEVELDTLNTADRQSIYAMKRQLGDQVMILAVSHAYLEPWIPMTIGAGRDWYREGFEHLAAFIDEVIDNGFYVQLHLAGDGQSAQKNPDGTWQWNDPVGWTYGYQWLMDNFESLASALQNHKGRDLTPFIRFVLGFDGVF